MTARKTPPKAPQPKPASAVKGSSKASATARRKLFVERYLVNGSNATDAAKFAGFSEHTAGSQGQRLLKHPETQALLGNRAGQVLVEAQLTTERWAKEMACIGHFDPRELYDIAGNLIPIHLLPEHVARAIAGVKEGEEGPEYKLWDKNAALANIGKHLGMFEQDNRQRTNAIQVNVQLLG